MEQTIKTWRWADENITLAAFLHDIVATGAYHVRQVVVTRYETETTGPFSDGSKKGTADAAIIVLDNVNTDDQPVDEMQTEAALDFLRKKGYIISKPSK
jgi:hypothetical protein